MKYYSLGGVPLKYVSEEIFPARSNVGIKTAYSDLRPQSAHAGHKTLPSTFTCNTHHVLHRCRCVLLLSQAHGSSINRVHQPIRRYKLVVSLDNSVHRATGIESPFLHSSTKIRSSHHAIQQTLQSNHPSFGSIERNHHQVLLHIQQR